MPGRKIVSFFVVVALIAGAVAVLEPLTAPTVVHAQVAPDGATDDQLRAESARATSQTASGEITCSITSTNGFAQCISWIGYFIASITSYLAYFGAYFFSYAVQISLNSAAYSLDFISGGWEITRDVANMSFLFILVFIALTIMFKAETGDTIRTLAAVVVVALLVNFSFFFTRVVIDAGNILAVQFYNAIDVRNQDGSIATIGGSEVKDLTAGIMNAVPVFSLFGSESFQTWQASGGAGFTNTLILTMLIFLSASAMYILLAFTFLYVGIKFVLRVVGLWLVIVASPLAFVARTTESTTKYFEKWVNALVGFSIYPAAFLFIFLVMTKMAQTIAGDNFIGEIFGAFNDPNALNSHVPIASAIANIGVRMGFIIAMLYFGMKLADRLIDASSMDGGFAGWASGKISSLVPRASFFAGRLAGTAALGVPGSIVSTGAIGRRLATSDSSLARGLWRGGRFLSQRSYDARSIPGVRAGFGLAGIDVGQAGGKGGVYAAAKEEQKQYDKARQEREADRKDLENQKAANDYTKLKTVSTPSAAQKAEIDRLEAKIQEFGKRELTAMSETSITKIASALKESQKKIIEDSDAYSDTAKERVGRVWHESSGDAPLKKANKIIEKLRDIDNALRTTIAPELRRHTTIGATMSSDNIKLMTDEITEKMAETNRDIDSTRRAGGDTKELHQDLHNLREALSSLGKLNDERKKVPMKVGEREDQGEFEVT